MFDACSLSHKLHSHVECWKQQCPNSTDLLKNVSLYHSKSTLMIEKRLSRFVRLKYDKNSSHFLYCRVSVSSGYFKFELLLQANMKFCLQRPSMMTPKTRLVASFSILRFFRKLRGHETTNKEKSIP